LANKEYTIFITCNGGMAYSLCTFNSLTDVMNSLKGMIQLENERHRPYYVLNDFYENEYPAFLNGKTFCIKERTVSDWEKYSYNTTKQETYNNVYKFPELF